jgi:hypothetical protein
MYKYAVIDITEKQLKDALAGKRIRIARSQIGSGTKELALHPEQAKRVENAVLKNKNVMLMLTDGELAATYERMMSSGSGWLSNIWKGIKKVFNVMKDTGALTQLADMAVAPLAAVTGQPALVGALRQGVKQVGGFGLKKGGRMSKTTRMSSLQGNGLYLNY